MRLDLVQDLLQLISELDRSPFPEGAAVSWMEALEGVNYDDARHTILEHYSSNTARDKRGEIRRMLPVDVRSGALKRADDRLRAARRALPVAPTLPLAERPAAVRDAVAKARGKAAEAVSKHRAEVERARRVVAA